AAPGSVLQVRPGTYTGFQTNKSLRIVLDFTSTTGSVQPPPGANYTIEVNGLAAGEPFVLVGRGAAIAPAGLGAVRIANVQGSVVLGGLTVAVGSGYIALDVQNAANVLVENSYFGGRNALQIQDASLASSGVTWSSPSGFGVVALRATLECTHGSFAGWRAPALRATDSAVRLAGNGSTTLRVNGSPTGPVAAFEAIQTDVQWEPSRFVLVPANGAPGLLQVGGQLAVADVPGLVTIGGPPGSTMTVRMTRAGSAPGLIVLGNLVPAHTAFGLTGIFWDQGQPVIVLAVGTVDLVGLARQAPWPNVPWLLGEVFCCQGVVVLPNGALLRSGPGSWAAL
ncbi:MAG: hypothetical protein Q7T30_03865, partial [Planctomycetota bacterium]|nr:hypothetical protein [Planctomycetota bacterium]